MLHNLKARDIYIGSISVGSEQVCRRGSSDARLASCCCHMEVIQGGGWFTGPRCQWAQASTTQRRTPGGWRSPSLLGPAARPPPKRSLRGQASMRPRTSPVTHPPGHLRARGDIRCAAAPQVRLAKAPQFKAKLKPSEVQAATKNNFAASWKRLCKQLPDTVHL